MKLLPLLLVVAIVAAAGTVCLLEGIRERPGPRFAGSSTAGASLTPRPLERVGSGPVEPAPALPVSETAAGLPALHERLDRLADRVTRLEASVGDPDRRPVAGAASTSTDTAELRALILETVAEERERRRADERSRAAEEVRQQREFDIRVSLRQADIQAQEWEVDVLVDLLLEQEERRIEILSRYDPASSSPEEFEREIDELDAWLRRRVSEELGPAIAGELFE